MTVHPDDAKQAGALLEKLEKTEIAASRGERLISSSQAAQEAPAGTPTEPFSLVSNGELDAACE